MQYYIVPKPYVPSIPVIKNVANQTFNSRSIAKHVCSALSSVSALLTGITYDYDYDYDNEISLFGHRRKKTNTKVS